jgi:hypothetical protein
LQGVTGLDGVTGLQGFTGLGLIGGTGVAGVTGLIGGTGLDGVTGLIGGTGVAGVTGVAPPNAVVVKDAAGTTVDSTIYTGMTTAVGLTGVVVTLPAAYSNTTYKIQLTYFFSGFAPANAGFLYYQVTSTTQFTIFSSNSGDANNVTWTTFGG